MAVTPLASPLYGGWTGDAEIAAHLTDAAEIRAMLVVEGALARAQGALGIIPAASAEAIAAAAAALSPDPASLAAGMASAGVPVPALVAALRAELPAEHAANVHRGATSQDIVDTGLVLRLRQVLDILDARLAAIIKALAEQAERHRDTPIAARTRWRIAAPTTLGAKVAAWGMPLVRHRARLAELRPRLLVLSLHGAAGTGAAFGDGAGALRAGVAADLGLAEDPVPWHATRDGLAELGSWLSLVTGSLGKFGQDLILLGQSEIGEVSSGAGGGSSTLPQKANPVAAETLVTLARTNAALLGGLHQALVVAQERDGAAWGIEWLCLPQMCVATGAATRLAAELAAGLSAEGDRIAATFAADQGLMLAEAAVFALAESLPRPDAEARVKEAIGIARRHGLSLPEALAAGGLPVPGLTPLASIGEAGAQADHFVECARGG
jgi:3-carboxy-cis,cis-muconate cycloisomerase